MGGERPTAIDFPALGSADWLPAVIFPALSLHDLWGVVFGSAANPMVKLCSRLDGAVQCGLTLEQWRIHGGEFFYPRISKRGCPLAQAGSMPFSRRIEVFAPRVNLLEYVGRPQLDWSVGVEVRYPVVPATPYPEDAPYLLVPKERASVWGKFDFTEDVKLPLNLCATWAKLPYVKRFALLTLREQALYRVYQKVPRKPIYETSELYV